MKIGINIENLYPGKIGGAEQYVRNTINEMGEIENVCISVFVNEVANSTFSDSETIKYYAVRSDEDVDIQLNFYIDMLNLEVMFCPLFYLAPKNSSIPVVVSVLDIQQDYLPQYFSKKVLKERRSLTKYTLAHADAIVTISEFSKKTILEKYDVAYDKIKVTYLNADSCFDDALCPQRLCEMKEKIGTDYIFFPANSWPHKNHLALLTAYVMLKEKYNTKLKLVFTGDGKQKQDEINEFIVQNNLQADVIYLGYVEQEDMPYIFANATILAFPSLFEGFGIPLVEAMKAGVAIACSNSTSLPEIAGDAAIFFDPKNSDDIAEKLHCLEVNEDLRKKLKNEGFARAKIFSWKKCAKETYDFLQEVQQSNLSKGQELNTYSEVPLVSIVTPSFNQGEFIRETIESVLGQNYPNIEYIVIDGGSTDDTINILKEYGDRITWKSERDEGQADAVNKGITMAKGEIIGWLNSDDTYLEGAIAKAVSFLTGHPQIDAVYGEGYYTDKAGNITGRYLTEKFDQDHLAEICYICQPTMFFGKNIIQKIGGLNKDLQLCMDYELWIRMSTYGRIAYIPEYLATSRMYDENKTLSKRREVFKEVCSVVRDYYKYVPDSWIYGYADWMCKGNRRLKFKICFAMLFVRYNYKNYKYMIQHALGWYKRITALKTDIFKGQYEDGWISSKYESSIEIKGGENVFQMEGIHLWPMEESLKIKVYLNRYQIAMLVIEEKGVFSKKIKLCNTLNKAEYKIKIICNNEFCPKHIGAGNDNRNLAFILKKITFLEEDA